MKRLKDLWLKLSYIGVSSDMMLSFSKRIVLSNQIILTLASMCLTFFLGWVIFGNLLMAFINVLMAGFFLALLLLNKKHHYNVSRLLILLTINLPIGAMVAIVGKSHDGHVSLFTLVGLPFLLYETRERLNIIIGCLIPVALFTVLYLNDFHIIDYSIGDFMPGLTEFTYFWNFAFVFFCMWYLVRATEKAEKQLAMDMEEKLKTQKLLEEERARSMNAMKLAAMGEMAGGMAHEINNPLSVVSLLSEQIKKNITNKTASFEFIQEKLQLLDAKIYHIANIINALRAFSQPPGGRPMEKLPLKRLIEEALLLCRERFTVGHVDLRIVLPTEERSVLGLKAELLQVLIILLSNAYDASLKTSSPWVKIEVDHTSERIKIKVSDNGPGVEPKNRDKIFQPFFTTKEVGQGMGLGLAMAKGIIDEHRGRLMLDTTAPHTTFVIELKSI